MRTFAVRHLSGFARRVPFLGGVLDVAAPGWSAEALTKQNTLRAYDRVYASDRLLNVYLSPARLEFYEELVTIFAPLAPRRILDVGCGTGNLLRLLVDRMAVVPEQVVGVDHSEAGIERARALLPTATWVVADLYSIPVTEPFDLVLCTEVLEHLQEPTRAVEQLRGLCGRGGRVAITVPDGAEDSWGGHVNFWDEAAFHTFLAPLGLTAIERVEGGRTLLAWLSPDS
jgi:trans-aconitate methyltransferase